jgi:TFA2 Winged helix domain 2
LLIHCDQKRTSLRREIHHHKRTKKMSNNNYGFDFLRREHLDHDDVVEEASGSFRKDDDNDEDGDGGDDGSPSHTGSGGGGGGGGGMTEELFKAARNKPTLEKQWDILNFLQAHRGSGCLAPNVIYKSTGIDLEVDTTTAEMLQKNPKVRVEMVPDPENPHALLVATYAYQAKYATVRNRATLLAQVNRMPNGIPMRDLQDSYPTVEDDLEALITAGDVMAVLNSEDKDKILFPRGEAFLVELDGIVTLPKFAQTAQVEMSAAATATSSSTAGLIGEKKKKDVVTSTGGDNPSMPPPTAKSSSTTTAAASSSSSSSTKVPPEVFVVETDMNPKKQIRRGEAVCVGGQWFRVSSAVKAGVKLSEQPSRAQAPLSVVSLTDLSKRNEADGYIRSFSAKTLPLDAALSSAAQRNLHQAKLARERLFKLAHGAGGRSIGSGVAGQLLGSQAHASNPHTLAASFAGSIVSSMRKRPHSKMIAPASSSMNDQQQQQEQRLQQQQQQRNQRARKDELEKAAADPYLSLYSHARRHGCTRDIREMYLATRSIVPEADVDLHALLLQHKLIEPNEQLRRPRLTKSGGAGSNVDNDGKPKKRRYYERKNQRMTNTHLEGTAIGAALARAAEQQKQGKSVGDGGM